MQGEFLECYLRRLNRINIYISKVLHYLHTASVFARPNGSQGSIPSLSVLTNEELRTINQKNKQNKCKAKPKQNKNKKDKKTIKTKQNKTKNSKLFFPFKGNIVSFLSQPTICLVTDV